MNDPHPVNRLPPDDAGQRMQRLRVGVTGLAAILIVVLLATAIASGVRRNASSEMPVMSAPAATTAPSANGVGAVDPNAEPLAQLGAAPGGAPEAEAPVNRTAE